MRTDRLIAIAALATVVPGAALAAPMQFLGNVVRDTGVTVVAPVDVSTSNPAPVTCLSGCSSPTVPSTFTPAQVTATSSATQIVAARAGRNSLIVENTGTTPLYLGGAGVTTSTGMLLPGVVGASISLSYTGALYGITASGSAVVTESEVY